MLKRLLVALSLVVIGGASLVFAPTAAAHEDVCTGLYSMHFQRGMRDVPGRYRRNNPFAMHMDVGTCVMKFGFQATGTVTGYCSIARGQGVTSSGHYFEYLWLGSEVTFTGQVQGTLHVVPDPPPLDSGSCNPSAFTGEHRIFLAGSLTKTHLAFVITGTDPPELPCMLNCWEA